MYFSVLEFLINFVYGPTVDLVLTIVLMALICLLTFNIIKRKKSDRLAESAKLKLAESYVDLKQAYDEVSTTKTELYEKYRELKKSKEHMKEVAYTDYLTGLPNRVAFMEKLNQVLGDVKDGEYLALLDIDIDDFKIVNDTLGHLSGDAVISSIADRLRGLISEDDRIGRVGGDEFILLFNHLKSEEECENKAVEVMHVFGFEHFKALDSNEVKLSASVGEVTIRPGEIRNTEILMRNLDTALFVAKDSGKNVYRVFDRSMEQMMLNRVKLQGEIRAAIEENQFELYYQPQMNLKTGKVGGFEALVRWHHPQKGLLVPDEFIPIAEDCGLIIDIGKMVLNKACKQLAEWEAKGCDVMVAVNLSAKQFRDPFLLDYVVQMIEEYKINPKNLELEITETVAIEDVNYAIKTLERLKKLGISFSLDDFGTGYSSLNYLKLLPVDNLKIDKSFMDSVTVDTSDRKIVESIITLAQALDLIVVAEGVEQGAQEDILKGMNCNKAQGYLYSRPVPANVAVKMIA